MDTQINNIARLSWQETKCLAANVGEPGQSYRKIDSDSVLDKSAAISLFQNLFKDLLINASKISELENPGQVLKQKLFDCFCALFPQLPQDESSEIDALAAIRFYTNPTNRALSTAAQDLERLTLSVVEAAINNLLDDSVTRAESVYNLKKDGMGTEGARVLLVNSIRLAAIVGLSETLIHSGDIGHAFTAALLSDFRGEPYHALSALYMLAQVNVANKKDDLSHYKIGRITGGTEQLADFLNQRFKELKPQVHRLLDDVITHLVEKALKSDSSIFEYLSQSRDLSSQVVNSDAISCLDFGSGLDLNANLNQLRERIVKNVSERVNGYTLSLTLTAWEAAPSQSGEPIDESRKMDLIDAILEIRRQQGR